MKVAIVSASLLCAAACTQPPVDEPLPTPPEGQWRLTWSDEFDAPTKSAPDQSKWSYDVGGHGWGNQQLEFNTRELDNAYQDGDGALVITAIKERYENNDYTSARLRTQGKFEQTYGRFEARVKLPSGAGLWPAFWLLGSSIGSEGWPECGELDILEQRGSQPAVIHGSAHGPGYSGGNPKTASTTLPGRTAIEDYHVYAVEWSPGEVHWFVDDVHFHAIREDAMPIDQRWVFDQPMFVIVNLAVGGWFGGDVDDSVFPKSVMFDYVRVYEATGEAAAAP